MNRRDFLAAGAVALGAANRMFGAEGRSRFGIATTCYLSVWRPKDTLEFLRHAVQLGAAGIQSAVTNLDPAYVKTLRSELEKNNLYFEAMIGLPKGDASQFEATLKAAKEAGAICARAACLGGRRYETFQTLDAWRKFVDDSKAAVARAVPIAERVGIAFALENHKDWTTDEFVALLKQYDSNKLQVCLDTGNNMSLLDDPYELVERLAPYAISTHIKDMGVAPAKDGFYLSEMVLGTGTLDMKRIIAMIQKARPNTHLTLEMITRDPLYVPCLTDRYWATFPDRNGVHLARAMRYVQEKQQKLPMLSTVAASEQRKTEDDNVRLCLRYS
jgi:3-oxoisoapionate decarboxylase